MKYTLYFQDVITSFNDFSEMLNNLTSIDTQAEESFLNYCYNKIKNKYTYNNIRYTEGESFMTDFSNIFEDIYYKFKADFEMINEMYALKSNDIKILQESINNTSLNPNNKKHTPTEALDFFGAQQATFNKINVLQAELNKLESTRALGVDNFLKAFRKLFMVVIPQNLPMYF